MAEKKSREKTVKGGGRKRGVPALLAAARKVSKELAAAIAREGRPRLAVSRAKKPMVREMPMEESMRSHWDNAEAARSTIPLSQRPEPGVPRGIMVLRPDQLDQVGLPEALVKAIRSDMEHARSVARKSMEAQQPAELGQRYDMSTDAADQMVNESDSPGLFINVCGCGGHVNLVISKPAIVPLKEGSENLVSAVQVDVRAIPGLISELRSIAESRGVSCP